MKGITGHWSPVTSHAFLPVSEQRAYCYYEFVMAGFVTVLICSNEDCYDRKTDFNPFTFKA